MSVISIQTNLGTIVIKLPESSNEKLARFEVVVFIFTIVMFFCTMVLCLAIICSCYRRKGNDNAQVCQMKQ